MLTASPVLFETENECIYNLAAEANKFTKVMPNNIYIYNMGCTNYMKEPTQETFLNK